MSNLFNKFNIRLQRKSITLVNNTIKVDMALATNFVKFQQKYALQAIQLNPIEPSVFFLKNRSGFANEIVHIAKYWWKSVNQTHRIDHITDIGTFVELVALHASRKGRRKKRKFNPHLKAFIRFLETLMKFEKLVEIDPEMTWYWCENKDTIEVLRNCATTTYERLKDLILNPSGTSTEADLIDKLFQI